MRNINIDTIKKNIRNNEVFPLEYGEYKNFNVCLDIDDEKIITLTVSDRKGVALNSLDLDIFLKQTNSNEDLALLIENTLFTNYYVD